MENPDDILNGAIESYCLGLLNTAESEALEQQAAENVNIKQAIDNFMQSLEEFAMANAINPGENARVNTLNLLHNLKLEETGDLHDLPLLNKYSDYKNWLHIVKPLLPKKLEDDFFTHQLRQDDKVMQTLLWLNVDYPEEVHDDVLESFIILEGRCICYVGDEEIKLGPGGFLEIPLYKHHDVKVLDTVLAVVQRVKVA